MTRSTTLLAMVCGMCVLAASAEAGQKYRTNESENDNSNNNGSPSFLEKVNQVRGLGQQISSGNFGLNSITSFKKHHKPEKPEKPETPEKPDDRVPIDPDKGDGPAPPQGRPGYVWVGDHWERVRAGSGTPQVVGPTLVEPVVRDHRMPPLAGSNGQGGVTVTATPEIRDHRTPKFPIVSGVGQGGVTVTATNQGPIVRDHRTATAKPVVRDHRAGSSSSPFDFGTFQKLVESITP